MGVLDEAIREHLELRRLHGADPSEVLREERAIFDDSWVESLEDGGELAGSGLGGIAISAGGDRGSYEARDLREGDKRVPETRAPWGDHATSQETAEFDMRAILGVEAEFDASRREIPTSDFLP